MTIRRITKYGEKILARKTKKVNWEKIKKELPAILEDMWDMLRYAKGLGLAANQINLDLQIAVISIPDEEKETTRDFTIINPQIIEREGTAICAEGCLSFPGVYAEVERADKIKVKFLNEKGEETIVSARGILSRAFQHEIDHLNGIVFPDRLTAKIRKDLMREIEPLKKKWAKIDETKQAKDGFSGNAGNCGSVS